MNKEQQRIKIAEACGFTVVSDGITHCLTPCDFGGMYTPEGKLLKKTPDYLNDLNAMHEAEQTYFRNHGSMVDLFDNLAKVMKVPNVSVALPFATAAQRAEAFLKTLKLWTNEA
jgi:hypothetical protein